MKKRDYDLTIILPKGYNKEISIEAFINKIGGFDISHKFWISRNLCYNIKGNSFGDYYIYNFSIEKDFERIKELESFLVGKEEILKFMLIKLEKKHEIKKSLNSEVNSSSEVYSDNKIK